MPIILHKHQLSNICNCYLGCHLPYFAPHSCTDLTLLLNLLLSIHQIFLFFHNGVKFNEDTIRHNVTQYKPPQQKNACQGD